MYENMSYFSIKIGCDKIFKSVLKPLLTFGNIKKKTVLEYYGIEQVPSLTFNCTNSTIEAQQKGVKYVQS